MTGEGAPTAGRWTRRGALAALAALAGCGGSGGGAEIGRQTGTASPTATETETGTATTTATGTGTETESESSTPTATATPQRARTPPPSTMEVLGRSVPDVTRTDGYYYVDTVVDLRNRESAPEPVTFVYLELRLDVYYESETVDRTHVVGGYVDRWYTDPNRFTPSEERTLRTELRTRPKNAPSDDTNAANYSLEAAFREVRYR
ncbi:MAG: hypothetical protein ABEJ79_09530 [Halolamina sp.]